MKNPLFFHSPSRRAFIASLSAASATMLSACLGVRMPEGEFEIPQPHDPTQSALMDTAFSQRKIAIDSGDQAYGAIIVKGEQIVGLGPSRVVVLTDPSAHAEIEAIRDACRRLGTRDLSGCVMYSTSKPCRMCETAAYWAGMERYYFGETIQDGGKPEYSPC